MRIRIVLAAVAAMLFFSAAPASAATGWTFHSGGYNDDVFTSNPCMDKGQELLADGTITAYQCRHNDATYLFDLYVVDAPWEYHSTVYNDDGWGTACFNVGNGLIADGSITTYECRGVGPYFNYIEVWVIV